MINTPSDGKVKRRDPSYFFFSKKLFTKVHLGLSSALRNLLSTTYLANLWLNYRNFSVLQPFFPYITVEKLFVTLLDRTLFFVIISHHQ